MLVSVQFKSRSSGEFTGRKYTYKCDYDAIVGDIVKVPAGAGEGIARITDINVPDYSVKSDVYPLLKTVIGPAEYEDTLFDNDPPADVPSLPETAISDNIIVIKQLPIIEDQLRDLRSTVEEKVQEALSLAVTEETVKVVKDVRAALNKEYKALEERRKQVKLAILEPYDRFEATYRECIGDLYTDADRQLKEKIDAVENGVKDEKRRRLKEFYEEYRAVSHLQDEEIASFESWPVNITKTASDKSLQQAARAYLDMIRGSLDTISTMENADEILVEYKVCKDLSRAITTVNERKRRAEEERARREKAAAEKAEREARDREVIEKVNAAAARTEPLAPPVAVPAPEPQPQEKIFPRFTFTVLNATKSQLIKVREFMKQEGIQYE